jgi:hypothetical protein
VLLLCAGVELEEGSGLCAGRRATRTVRSRPSDWRSLGSHWSAIVPGRRSGRGASSSSVRATASRWPGCRSTVCAAPSHRRDHLDERPQGLVVPLREHEELTVRRTGAAIAAIWSEPDRDRTCRWFSSGVKTAQARWLWRHTPHLLGVGCTRCVRRHQPCVADRRVFARLWTAIVCHRAPCGGVEDVDGPGVSATGRTSLVRIPASSSWPPATRVGRWPRHLSCVPRPDIEERRAQGVHPWAGFFDPQWELDAVVAHFDHGDRGYELPVRSSWPIGGRQTTTRTTASLTHWDHVGRRRDAA